MKLRTDSANQQEVRIEIVPLIDVIFCILTFFILAAVTLTRQAAINVDLPKAQTGTSQMREMLIVSVDPIGQTYLEKQPVSRDQLFQALLKFHQARPDGLMVLYASRSASYNDVVQVLDLLRSVGGDRVALATLPGADAEPQQPASGLGATDPLGLPGAGGTGSSNFNPNALPGAGQSGLQPNPGAGTDAVPSLPSSGKSSPAARP